MNRLRILGLLSLALSSPRLRPAPTRQGGGEGIDRRSLVDLPFGIALARREENNFQRMILRITKVKSLDTCSGRIPCRQSLRAGRNVLHLVLAQLFVRLVHISHNDGDVLKPVVVTL